MPTTPSARSEALFVVVHRRIKASQEAAFEAAMCEFTRFALTQPGQQGMQLVKPEPGSRDYTVIASFVSLAERRAFTSSPDYRDWMRRLGELTEGDPRISELSGMETWFSPQRAQAAEVEDGASDFCRGLCGDDVDRLASLATVVAAARPDRDRRSNRGRGVDVADYADFCPTSSRRLYQAQ